jgi:hypothetical protein
MVLPAGCREADTRAKSSDTVHVTAHIATARFVAPPLPAANVPYVNYVFDVAGGDTIVYKTGSILLFPPDAFVDEKGRAITGNVEVRYREFRNPVDIFLAGIPMSYDSAGQTHQFVSAGMFEMLAFKNGKAVFVNPARKPVVNLASRKDAITYNVYYLDTVKRNWVYEEVSRVLEPKRKLAKAKRFTEVLENTIAAPSLVVPKKPTGNSPVIRIRVSTGSYGELSVYDNLKFQLDEKQPFDPHDADEVWLNVKVYQRRKNDLYVIQFSNARKSITYLARPVFEGLDYDAALKVFSEKQKEYSLLKQRRLELVAKQRVDFVKDSLANGKADKAEDERIRKLNMVIAAKNKELEELETQAGELLREYRAVQVHTLGYFNCDAYPEWKRNYLTASYVNIKGGPLKIDRAAVISKGVNGVRPMKEGGRIELFSDFENAIIGMIDGGIAFITFEEVKKRHITHETQTHIFPMTVLAQPECTYDKVQHMVYNRP